MINTLLQSYKQEPIFGPYLRPGEIEPYFMKWLDYKDFTIEEFGRSEEKRSLRYLKWGTGGIKIVLWSQMHGNEATATLSLVDIIEFLQNERENFLVKEWQENLSIYFIPMLNPDGAELFTRRNAHQVDMNRDALKRQSAEMRAFFKLMEQINPDWAFNLHDQRSIFSIGSDKKTATLSFLAPSPDLNRSISTSRLKTMKLIAAIHQGLQKLSPGHFGRYTDEFYPRAVGDNLMAAGIPCILLEAGAYAEDPSRMKARELISKGLLIAFQQINAKTYDENSVSNYEAIPENEQLLRDILLKNVKFRGKVCDIALQEVQKLNENHQFESYFVLDDLGDLNHLKGIKEWQGGDIVESSPLILQNRVDFIYTTSDKKWSFKNGHLQK